MQQPWKHRTILLAVIIVFVGCQPTQKENAAPNVPTAIDTASPTHTSVVLPQDIGVYQDTAENKQLLQDVQTIQNNFKRLNATTAWMRIDSISLEESTEGGIAKFYYLQEGLAKIIVQNFGETGRQATEFYLLNGALSFAFEKTYFYNRPIYYDTAAMKTYGDEEVFDMKKAKVAELRSYFKNNTLLYQVPGTSNNEPISKEHLLQEEKRISSYLSRLRQMANSK
jgi:hypothetical protein